MKCQNCGKEEANVRYTQIINGVKKEIFLCTNCAKELGVDTLEMPDFPMNFNSFLGDFFNDYMERELLPSFQTEAVKCKTCGMTYDDFIKTGMFGCSNCYSTFSIPIETLLKNLQGSTKHIGRKLNSIKEPIKAESTDAKQKQEEAKEDNKILKLQKDLEKAIKQEKYEEAAKIRDEIKKLKNDNEK